MNNPHVPDQLSRDTVKALVLAGSTQKQIGDVLHIDEKTLCKYYREELDNELVTALGRVAKTAFQKAFEGDTKMIEFVLKCRGRWSYHKEEDDKKSTTDTLLEKLIDKL